MQRFKDILVVADEASASEALFVRARWLAETNAAALTLIDVIDAAPGELSRLYTALPDARASEVEDRVLDVHRARLARLAEPLRAAGLPVETKVLQGLGFLEIIRHVIAHGNDLVLKGAHRAPERQALCGPDLHLLRQCPCPVWLLNSPAEPKARRIMAAVDPDPAEPTRDALNHMVLALATSLAKHDGAQLDVVNAWHLEEESTLRHSHVEMSDAELTALVGATEADSAARLNALVADCATLPAHARILHVKGQPADVLLEHAESERTDILVMGTVARTGIAGLFIGNTAETVLNRVGCSVLTVKPEGFTSPVTLQGKDAA